MALVEWVCVAVVNSVVSVKGEEILRILERKSNGNMSDNGEGSAEDPTMKVKAIKVQNRKFKAVITRQLNESAGGAAGISSGVEPRSLEEMEGI